MERSEAMPIRGSPNGARHSRPQGGRDPPEWVDAINRNGRSQTIVTAGRDHPVRADFAARKVSAAALAIDRGGESRLVVVWGD
jgi:hypothetical protein